VAPGRRRDVRRSAAVRDRAIDFCIDRVGLVDRTLDLGFLCFQLGAKRENLCLDDCASLRQLALRALDFLFALNLTGTLVRFHGGARETPPGPV
jgi:hypothetical protein